MKRISPVTIIIVALVLLILVLCAVVPGFAGAVATTLECAFATYKCVKVIP